MARILLIPTEFPAVRLEPVIEPKPEPISIITPTPWYNDLSHDITDSTVFRCLLIIVVFDHVWRWMRG
jgi:hypothetical protein